MWADGKGFACGLGPSAPKCRDNCIANAAQKCFDKGSALLASIAMNSSSQFEQEAT